MTDTPYPATASNAATRPAVNGNVVFPDEVRIENRKNLIDVFRHGLFLPIHEKGRLDQNHVGGLATADIDRPVHDRHIFGPPAETDKRIDTNHVQIVDRMRYVSNIAERLDTGKGHISENRKQIIGNNVIHQKQSVNELMFAQLIKTVERLFCETIMTNAIGIFRTFAANGIHAAVSRNGRNARHFPGHPVGNVNGGNVETVFRFPARPPQIAQLDKSIRRRETRGLIFCGPLDTVRGEDRPLAFHITRLERGTIVFSYLFDLHFSHF